MVSKILIDWRNSTLTSINVSSMIKRVLGQPNFSPQTNATQLFPKINTNFNNLSSVKVNTIMSVVLS